MTWRPERERAGLLKVWLRDGSGAALVLRLEDTARLVAALRAESERWFEGTDLYGDPITFRLDLVVAVMPCSAASLEAYDAEQDEKALHDGD